MILRLSQNLNSKIKTGKLTEVPLDENPFADWSAHLFVVNRAQYILLSNTATLYSCVMFGRGITNDQRFLDGALGTIREFIEEDGLSDIYQNWIAPSTATVTFSKALNRKVTSSINQLVSMATAVLESGEVPPFRVGFELNGFLLSIIAESKKKFRATARGDPAAKRENVPIPGHFMIARWDLTAAVISVVAETVLVWRLSRPVRAFRDSLQSMTGASHSEGSTVMPPFQFCRP